MNDSELDTLLREATPSTPVPPGLGAHRALILADARTRRSRRLRVWAASVAASIVLIGGGSVAMAGDGNETPWGWVADNVFSIETTSGDACFQGIVVRWEGLAEDDPLVVDAKAYVGGLDLATLDTADAEAEERAANRAALAEGVHDHELSDAAIRQNAIHRVVAEGLWAHLDARGHVMSPGHEVSLSSQTTACD